jgi:hypothetical protein
MHLLWFITKKKRVKMSNNGEWRGGKGSVRRNSNEKLYSENWDKIFNKKNKEDKCQKEKKKK